MATQWIEHISSGSMNRDLLSHGSKVRVFKVWGTTAAAIFNNPASIIDSTSSLALPALGTGTGDGLTLDRYDIGVENSVLVVNAIYSNDQRGRLSDRPPTPGPGIVLREGGFQTEKSKIPYAEKQRVYVVTATTGGIVSGWELKTFEDTYSLRRETYRVRIPLGNLDAAIAAMEVQQNVLHLINGWYYRFAAGDYRAISSTEAEVVYNWFRDAGTLYPVAGHINTSGKVVYPQPMISKFPGDTPRWLRPPFHQVLPQLNDTDPTDPPLFYADLFYKVDELGWQTLVGVT